MSTSLSAAADDRKARLANLRNLKRKQPTDEVAPPESIRSPSPPGNSKQDATLQTDTQAHDEAETQQPKPLQISGRNYDIEARGPKLGFESAPNEGLDKPTLEEQAAEIEAESRRRAEKEAQDDKGIDLFKLQPKKPNWDLRRELDRKMEVLNVRTDNAIARLVRERITGAQRAKQAGGQQATTAEQASAQADGESTGMDGVALVEGLRMREKEEEEEERREKEDLDA